jgi:hypothetical protein
MDKVYVYSYGQDYPRSDFSLSLSHFTDVWDPHVRVVFNLPPQHPLSVAVLPRLHLPCLSTPRTRRAGEETLAKATHTGDVRDWL